MKAVILAAGKGTRLDGAAVKPKCLVEIGGQTLLQRQIESLRNAGIDRIVIVVGFGADSIRDECDSDIAFVENLNYEGMPLRIVYKGKVSGNTIELVRNVAEIADEKATAKRAK